MVDAWVLYEGERNVKFDIFFSICQTPVDGYTPSERVMFQNFFDQAIWADQLGFGCAWVAETHLSCQVQKQNRYAVIPHFEGEIGLNTDILQIAHALFAKTKSIHIGSAIRNIQCNGGPIAHAEAIKMFLTIHELGLGRDPQLGVENRRLEIGFASGRFPFSNIPYGIYPRSPAEEVAWPALRGLVFRQATEIFLKLLRGDIVGMKDLDGANYRLSRRNFRNEEDWERVIQAAAGDPMIATAQSGTRSEVSARFREQGFEVQPFWKFERVGVIPFEAPMKNLRLTIGAHDAEMQDYANTILPCGVFNLSITPGPQIEATHTRMSKTYQARDSGDEWGAAPGNWSRELMPRTALVFINEDRAKAREQAGKAIANYWKAVEGTLDPGKVAQAVDNALVGTPQEIVEQINQRFHADDRLMLWFDFNNHDNQAVKHSMRLFKEKCAPHAKGRLS